MSQIMIALLLAAATTHAHVALHLPPLPLLSPAGAHRRPAVRPVATPPPQQQQRFAKSQSTISMAISAPPALTSATKTAGSLSVIISVDVALRRFFLARAIPFPSSLAGMLGLFGTLCTLQAIRPKLASSIADAAAPGCAFISRWLALFFVPNLVLLPIVISMSAAEAGKLLLLIVVGLSASLPLCAIVAMAALGATGGPAPPPPPVPEQWRAPPPPPPPVRAYLLDPPLIGLSAGSAGMAALALASHHSLLGLSSVLPPAGVLLNLHLLTATICGFVAGGSLVPKSVQKILHPLISCTALTQLTIVLYSLLSSQPITGVLRGYLVPGATPLTSPGNLLLFMLGPATLSFGFQMFSRRTLMQQSAKAVTAVTAIASSFGLFATAFAGRVLSMDMPIRLAALPRQVTAPLAIAIAGIIKADPSLAATIVVVTGLLCANFGKSIPNDNDTHSS